MRHAALALAIGTALAGACHSSANDDLELLAAQQELKLARRHLQAAPHAYEGHRRTALDHVNQAIQEIRGALASARAARGADTGSAP
jgi:hypothetical protein